MTRDEARAAGLPRYPGANPCCYGHTGERYTSNSRCCECVLEQKARQRERDGITGKRAAKLAAKSRPEIRLPVAQSEFMRSLTKAELMGRRA